MNSHADKPFRDCLLVLSQEVQEDARKAFLQFKKVTGKNGDEYWSARIGLHFRALGRLRKDGIHWFWTGTHADYDKLLG